MQQEIKPPTIIKHDPELNTIPLKDFKSVEMDLFFSIIARVQQKGDNIIRIKFDELKELSDYKPTANKRFIDDIESTYKKLLTLTFGQTSKDKIDREYFIMFTRFRIHGSAEIPYVEIQVHDLAIPLINNLDRWVRYTLQEFNSLDSRYSKTMYRLLKQWRTVGKAYYKKEVLYELLDVPTSYTKKTENFNQFVLEPILRELSPIFRGLEVKKVRANKRGRPLIAYEFTFKAEPKDKGETFIPQEKPYKDKEQQEQRRNRPPITMYNWLEGK